MDYIPSLEDLDRARSNLPNPYGVRNGDHYKVIAQRPDARSAFFDPAAAAARLHTLEFRLESTYLNDEGIARTLKQWVYHGPVRV